MNLTTSTIASLLLITPSLIAYVYYKDRQFYGNKELRMGLVMQLLIFILLLSYIWYHYLWQS